MQQRALALGVEPELLDEPGGDGPVVERAPEGVPAKDGGRDRRLLLARRRAGGDPELGEQVGIARVGQQLDGDLQTDAAGSGPGVEQRGPARQMQLPTVRVEDLEAASEVRAQVEPVRPDGELPRLGVVHARRQRGGLDDVPELFGGGGGRHAGSFPSGHGRALPSNAPDRLSSAMPRVSRPGPVSGRVEGPSAPRRRAAPEPGG